jgi:hemerythrin-like domain-containing protein
MTDQELAPAPPGRSADRARALGGELVEIHEWLRTELARIRDEIGSYIGGDTARPAALRAHCTAFCLALTRHHTSEDTTAFPALGEQFPELTTVLEELRQDHVLVADILRTLRRLLATLTADNAERVRGELAGLAAILESHFRWEERRLVNALNALDAPPTGEELFGAQA